MFAIGFMFITIGLGFLFGLSQSKKVKFELIVIITLVVSGISFIFFDITSPVEQPRTVSIEFLKTYTAGRLTVNGDLTLTTYEIVPKRHGTITQHRFYDVIDVKTGEIK